MNNYLKITEDYIVYAQIRIVISVAYLNLFSVSYLFYYKNM